MELVVWPEVKVEPSDDDTLYGSSDQDMKTEHSSLKAGARDGFFICFEDETKVKQEDDLARNVGERLPATEKDRDSLTDDDKDMQPAQTWPEVKVEIDVADTVFLGGPSHHQVQNTSTSSGGHGPHSIGKDERCRRREALAQRENLAPKSAREPAPKTEEDPGSLSLKGNRTAEAEVQDTKVAEPGSVDEEVLEEPLDSGNARHARQAETASPQFPGSTGPKVPAADVKKSEPEIRACMRKSRKKQRRNALRCRECLKEFSSRSYLKIHAVVHSGEKPFRCDQCFSAFGYASNLRHHKKSIHRSDRPHKREICPLTSHDCEECPELSAVHSVKWKSPSEQVGFSLDKGEGSPGSSELSSTPGQGDVRTNVLDSLPEPIRFQSAQETFLSEKDSAVQLVQCDICSKILEKSQQKHHMSQHSLTFKCKQCSKILSSLEELTKHVALHGRAPSYKCNHCSLQFAFPGNLETHLKRAHKSCAEFLAACVTNHNPSPATVHKTASEGKTSEDSSQVSPASTARQGSAAPKDDDLESLPVHFVSKKEGNCSGNDSPEPGTVTRENASGPHRTGVNYQTQKRSETKGHVAKHHATYTCRDCLKVFRCPSDLRKHAVVHTGEKPFKCDQCPSRFALSTYLSTHRRRTHTSEKPFRCELCSAAFRERFNLQTHLKVHRDERPFQCHVCSAAFRHASSLSAHRLTHSGQSPFKCDRCSARFNSAGNLKQHRRVHSDERPFKCDRCTADFKFSSYLKLHKRTHTGEKPYVCGQCDAAFIRSQYLQKHKKSHNKKDTEKQSWEV